MSLRLQTHKPLTLRISESHIPAYLGTGGRQWGRADGLYMGGADKRRAKARRGRYTEAVTMKTVEEACESHLVVTVSLLKEYLEESMSTMEFTTRMKLAGQQRTLCPPKVLGMSQCSYYRALPRKKKNLLQHVEKRQRCPPYASQRAAHVRQQTSPSSDGRASQRVFQRCWHTQCPPNEQLTSGDRRYLARMAALAKEWSSGVGIPSDSQ